MKTNCEVSKEEEAGRFLERDFSECFNQLRHYDSQIIGIFKFSFTSYASIIAVAIGLYQFGHEKGIDLSACVKSLLAFGFLLGSFMLWLIARIRVYFVKVARFLNEHRKFFLSIQPLGFQNLSEMYTDTNHPEYFQWNSSQLMFTYISALLNAALLVALVYMQFSSWSYIWPTIIVTLFLYWLLQISLGVKFLKKQGATDPSSNKRKGMSSV